MSMTAASPPPPTQSEHCIYKCGRGPTVTVPMTHPAPRLVAPQQTERSARSPPSTPPPAKANVLYLTLAPLPFLFYIKMSRKWKLSSGNFFNLCAQIKVMCCRALLLTQRDADVHGSIDARGIMPYQSINLQ